MRNIPIRLYHKIQPTDKIYIIGEYQLKYIHFIQFNQPWNVALHWLPGFREVLRFDLNSLPAGTNGWVFYRVQYLLSSGKFVLQTSPHGDQLLTFQYSQSQLVKLQMDNDCITRMVYSFPIVINSSDLCAIANVCSTGLCRSEK